METDDPVVEPSGPVWQLIFATWPTCNWANGEPAGYDA